MSNSADFNNLLGTHDYKQLEHIKLTTLKYTKTTQIKYINIKHHYSAKKNFVCRHSIVQN
jgi:hypothetical protein